MNQLVTACKSILTQLENVVEQVTEQDFVRPSDALSHATIGQHLRHTIEFFIGLESGYEKGVINYDKRDHDYLIETDKVIAAEALRRIQNFVSRHHHAKALILEVAYELSNENCVTIDTNYHRELVYNIEHAVHHMAIMKIGIREVAPYVELPADFGVAVSTIRFKAAVSAG